MSFIPKAHEIYKHFKGNLYQIVAIAKHTETGEQLVIYQAMYGDFSIYARPLDMFVSPVDKEKYPDVEQVFRFELQGEDRDRQVRESDIPMDDVHSINNSKEKDDFNLDKPEGENSNPNLDPMVVEFLDADSYEEKLNILAGLHHRITDDMITTMAISCDVEVDEGSIEERYLSLRNCLLTFEKYECNRLR